MLTTQMTPKAVSPSSTVESRQLGLESTLAELELYRLQIEDTSIAIDISKIFDCNPILPGI
ncbi:hypothetical protein VB714_15385, partial [Spirulina sp. 06S082]